MVDYLVPMQFLEPAQKGRNENGDLLFASACLSGIKLSGSGQIFGSRWIAYAKRPISVPAGSL